MDPVFRALLVRPIRIQTLRLLVFLARRAHMFHPIRLEHVPHLNVLRARQMLIVIQQLLAKFVRRAHILLLVAIVVVLQLFALQERLIMTILHRRRVLHAKADAMSLQGVTVTVSRFFVHLELATLTTPPQLRANLVVTELSFQQVVQAVALCMRVQQGRLMMT